MLRLITPFGEAIGFTPRESSLRNPPKKRGKNKPGGKYVLASDEDLALQSALKGVAWTHRGIKEILDTIHAAAQPKPKSEEAATGKKGKKGKKEGVRPVRLRASERRFIASSLSLSGLIDEVPEEDIRKANALLDYRRDYNDFIARSLAYFFNHLKVHVEVAPRKYNAIQRELRPIRAKERLENKGFSFAHDVVTLGKQKIRRKKKKKGSSSEAKRLDIVQKESPEFLTASKEPIPTGRGKTREYYLWLQAFESYAPEARNFGYDLLDRLINTAEKLLFPKNTGPTKKSRRKPTRGPKNLKKALSRLQVLKTPIFTDYIIPFAQNAGVGPELNLREVFLMQDTANIDALARVYVWFKNTKKAYKAGKKLAQKTDLKPEKRIIAFAFMELFNTFTPVVASHFYSLFAADLDNNFLQTLKDKIADYVFTFEAPADQFQYNPRAADVRFIETVVLPLVSEEDFALTIHNFNDSTEYDNNELIHHLMTLEINMLSEISAHNEMAKQTNTQLFGMEESYPFTPLMFRFVLGSLISNTDAIIGAYSESKRAVRTAVRPYEVVQDRMTDVFMKGLEAYYIQMAITLKKTVAPEYLEDAYRQILPNGLLSRYNEMLQHLSIRGVQNLYPFIRHNGKTKISPMFYSFMSGARFGPYDWIPVYMQYSDIPGTSFLGELDAKKLKEFNEQNLERLKQTEGLLIRPLRFKHMMFEIQNLASQLIENDVALNSDPNTLKSLGSAVRIIGRSFPVQFVAQLAQGDLFAIKAAIALREGVPVHEITKAYEDLLGGDTYAAYLKSAKIEPSKAVEYLGEQALAHIVQQTDALDAVLGVKTRSIQNQLNLLIRNIIENAADIVGETDQRLIKDRVYETPKTPATHKQRVFLDSVNEELIKAAYEKGLDVRQLFGDILEKIGKQVYTELEMLRTELKQTGISYQEFLNLFNEEIEKAGLKGQLNLNLFNILYLLNTVRNRIFGKETQKAGSLVYESYRSKEKIRQQQRGRGRITIRPVGSGIRRGLGKPKARKSKGSQVSKVRKPKKPKKTAAPRKGLIATYFSPEEIEEIKAAAQKAAKAQQLLQQEASESSQIAQELTTPSNVKPNKTLDELHQITRTGSSGGEEPQTNPFCRNCPTPSRNPRRKMPKKRRPRKGAHELARSLASVLFPYTPD